jgi:hypothetical protein
MIDGGPKYHAVRYAKHMLHATWETLKNTVPHEEDEGLANLGSTTICGHFRALSRDALSKED